MKRFAVVCLLASCVPSQHELRAPVYAVIGDREKEKGAISVRTRSGEDLGSMSLPAFVERLQAESGPH